MLLSFFYYLCLTTIVTIVLTLLDEKFNKQPYKAICSAMLVITLFSPLFLEFPGYDSPIYTLNEKNEIKIHRFLIVFEPKHDKIVRFGSGEVKTKRIIVSNSPFAIINRLRINYLITDQINFIKTRSSEIDFQEKIIALVDEIQRNTFMDAYSTKNMFKYTKHNSEKQAPYFKKIRKTLQKKLGGEDVAFINVKQLY